MCFKHWAMVPQSIRTRVVVNYRQGQCDDKRPSATWCRAADEAIQAVSKREAFLIQVSRSTERLKEAEFQAQVERAKARREIGC